MNRLTYTRSIYLLWKTDSHCTLCQLCLAHWMSFAFCRKLDFVLAIKSDLSSSWLSWCAREGAFDIRTNAIFLSELNHSCNRVNLLGKLLCPSVNLTGASNVPCCHYFSWELHYIPATLTDSARWPREVLLPTSGRWPKKACATEMSSARKMDISHRPNVVFQHEINLSASSNCPTYDYISWLIIMKHT